MVGDHAIEGAVPAKRAIAAAAEIRLTAAGMRRCDKKYGVVIFFVFVFC